MSDALTLSPAYRAQDVDLAQITPRSPLTKPTFPSYFESFPFFTRHGPGAAAPAEKPLRVRRKGRFPSGKGLGNVV
jgi:hypothetical protein